MISTNVSAYSCLPMAQPAYQSEAKPAVPLSSDQTGIQDSLNLSSAQAGAEPHSSDADILARRLVGKRGDPSEVTILAATKNNDEITVSSAENGGITVDINGNKSSFTAAEAKKLVIDALDGNDKIIVQEEVRVPLFITGGSGNDFIQGGSGDDTIIDNYGQNEIHGGRGNDRIIAGGFDLDSSSPATETVNGVAVNGNIISGGLGRDYIEGSNNSDHLSDEGGGTVIYGLDGSDFIEVTSGQNYVDGGRGNDIISAAEGHNMLFGGRGNDAISMSGGSGVIVDGSGSNAIKTADESKAKIYASSQTEVEAGSHSSTEEVTSVEVPKFFSINGDASFKNRVTSDLEALGDIPVGQIAYTAIAETGRQVSVSETPNGNQCSSGADGYYDHEAREANAGSDSTIYYNRASVSLNANEAWQDRPPLVGFHHELMHSYNAASGTMDNWAYDPYSNRYADGPFGVVGAELQAVGIDHALVQQNPDGLSENSMRAFLGLARRERY
ncbi:MAG: M91 family zinc metallopeptidase [Candidatus Bruticola sp.]